MIIFKLKNLNKSFLTENFNFEYSLHLISKTIFF